MPGGQGSGQQPRLYSHYAEVREYLAILDWDLRSEEIEKQCRQIGVLEQEIKDLDQRKIQCNSEKTQMEMRIHALEYKILPELYQELNEKGDTLSEWFSSSLY